MTQSRNNSPIILVCCRRRKNPMDISLLLFWSKKLLATLLLPPVLPLLPLLGGLLLLRRRPRAARALLWSGLALQFALIIPLTVAPLLASVERMPALTPQASASAQAIVILGAGRREHAPEYGGQTVNRLALERLRYGAHLARRTDLPVLVSGGSSDSSAIAEAALMKTVLEEDFGVAVRWTEAASWDTRQNARLSAKLLNEAGIHRILLVTHAAHMRRASREFEAAGLEVIPAPTAWLAGEEGAAPGKLRSWMPSPNTAYAGWFALHEMLGELAYRLGR